MVNLKEKININNILDLDLINNWNTVINSLFENDSITTIEITPVEAKKYTYDFVGLLYSLNIPKEYHYPHILVNNLSSSREYQGRITTINIIPSNALELYLERFTT